MIADGQAVVPLVRARLVAFDGQFGDEVGDLFRGEIEETVGIVVTTLTTLPLCALVRHLLEALQLAGGDSEAAGVVANGGLTPRRLRPLVGLRTGDVSPFFPLCGLQVSERFGS